MAMISGTTDGNILDPYLINFQQEIFKCVNIPMHI